MNKSFQDHEIISWLVKFIFVFPLIDMLVIKDIPLITTGIYTIISILLCPRLFRCKFNAVLALLCGYIVSLIIVILFEKYNLGHLMFGLTLLTYTLLGLEIGDNGNLYTKCLLQFGILFFVLNTAIWIVRLDMYGYQLDILRGNISIYGGNTAHLVYMFVCLFVKKYWGYGKPYYCLLGICFINATMYVSKGALVISLVWFLFEVIDNKKSYFVDEIRIVELIISGIVIMYTLVEMGVIDSWIERINIWGNQYEIYGMLGERGEIWVWAGNYLNENMLYLPFGIGPTCFGFVNPWEYSNVHNIIMDVIMDAGIIGGLFFGWMTYKTFQKSAHRKYYILCVVYGIFEGIAMFTIDYDNCIMVGCIYMFFCIEYLDSLKREVFV